DPLAGGQPFANNLIPANRINPVSSKLIKFWPAPNTSGALNFTSPNSSADTEEPQVLARVDFHRSANDRWHSSFAADFTAAVTTNAISEFAFKQPLRTWTEELTNTRTFKDRYVNVASFHFFR